MKQLGNLAIACAGRPDVTLKIESGMVTLRVKHGPEEGTDHRARWDDDSSISGMIYALNFGHLSRRGDKAA